MEPVILFGGALILLAVYTFLSALRSLQTATFPKSVPVMGPRAELFSITRASFRQITGGIGTLLEGYRRHGQHDRPFVVYDPSAQQELLLPVKDLKWFAEQPDSKLSSHGVRNERHAVKYLHMGIELGTTMHFLERISGDRLARNLDALQPALHDELRTCIDRVFGLDTEEWREINVYSSLNDVVMPAISRAFLGLPLSRDPRVLNAFHRYIMALGLGTIFVGELPRFLKAVVARVVKLPLWYYRNKTLSILTPVVEAQLRRKTANPGEEGLEFVRACAKISEKNAVGGMGNAASAEVIAEWIMSLGFAGASSTIIQTTNLLLDVANCSTDMQLWEKLRAEANGTLPSDTAWSQPESFKQQTLADSVIRESLRFHPILIKGLSKEVVPREGLQLPGGTQMPQGSWVGIPVLGIHRDERYYPGSDEFQPFRFFKESRAGGAAKTSAYEDELDAAKPTTTYLGFGYGRHACPGRWFAVLMLKMTLAYISMHYDVQGTGQPPPTRVLGDAALPPMSATIKVRRRRKV